MYIAYAIQPKPEDQDPLMSLGLLAIGALLLVAFTSIFFFKDFRRVGWAHWIFVKGIEGNVATVTFLWLVVLWWFMPVAYVIWIISLPIRGLIMFIRYRRLRKSFVKGALKRQIIPGKEQPPVLVDAQSVLITEGVELAVEPAVVQLIQIEQPHIQLSTGLTQMTNTPFQDIQAVCQYFLAYYINKGISAYEYVGMGPYGNGFQIDIILKSNQRVQFSAVSVNGNVVQILKAVPHRKPLALPPDPS